MLVVLLIFTGFVLFLYDHFIKNNNYWKDRNVPGPEPTFFFGNLKDEALGRRSTVHIYKEICDQYPNEKLIGIFRMRSPDLLVKDLEIIKSILIRDCENFLDRDVEYIKEGLGANLFHANRDTWRPLRHRFTPIFTSGKLKNMMYLITESADKLVDYVDKIASVDAEQEVHGITKKFTEACIATCGFGLAPDTFDNPDKVLEKLEVKIFSLTYRSRLEMLYPGILRRMGISLLAGEVSQFFYDLTKHIIAQRNGERIGRNDFMDLMLDLRNKGKDNETEETVDMTDDVIAGQMFIFYTAGYQTSATTMAFMLYHLAKNPDIQDKVVAEIEEVLKKHEGKLTYQAVLDLKYMGQVFDETLRLHPIADTLRRRAISDCIVPGTDLKVKKGQIFLVPIPAIHMDPNIYPNPELFDPDRFTPEKVSSRHSCAYLPFGVGPRHCIGIRFAQVVSRSGMARLLSSYRVEPSPQTPPRFHYVPRIVMYPRGGFPLKLVRRC